MDAGMPSFSGAVCGGYRSALGLGLAAGGNSGVPCEISIPPKDENETIQKVTETQNEGGFYLKFGFRDFYILCMRSEDNF